MPPEDPHSTDPQSPDTPSPCEFNSRPLDATRDSTGADISPEIELRHGTEYSAAEFPANSGSTGDRGSPGSPAGTPKPKRGCTSCLILFIVLGIIAVLGNWFSRQTGSPTIAVPNIPHLPSVELPTFRYPDISSLPSNQPGVQPPTIFSPQPTPHTLPENVSGVLEILEPVMRERFQESVENLGLTWPPARVRLVGLKMEKLLELWAANATGPYHRIKVYPVFAASGDIGPKRREGDKQVPEGHYRLVYLNPSSSYHLSLLLDYPNAADKVRESAGLADGAKLGGEICVHGSAASVGCLAIGDPAIEEVFTFVAMADSSHRDIIILPADLRKRSDLVALAGENSEVLKLYSSLKELAESVTPENQGLSSASR